MALEYVLRESRSGARAFEKLMYDPIVQRGQGLGAVPTTAGLSKSSSQFPRAAEHAICRLIYTSNLQVRVLERARAEIFRSPVRMVRHFCLTHLLADLGHERLAQLGAELALHIGLTELFLRIDVSKSKWQVAGGALRAGGRWL